jgi:EmrB/QacA subfamily drug resistance transporter
VTAPLRLNTREGKFALTATILGSTMVFLDGTIANVATRRIGLEFGASFGALQWVLNGYMLPLASLILLGGSLGDRLGRKRVYLVGVTGFAVASLLCAVAPSIGALIAARALQGIFGALLTPGSLALITAVFAPADLGRAVGAWSGLTSMSTAIGPFLGGYLVTQASWRWAFAINLPIAVAVMWLSRCLPESVSDEERKPLDIAGTVLIALGLGALTYGATEAGNTGWHAGPIAAVLVGLALVAGFVTVEVRGQHPLVPPKLFANRTFTAANLMTFGTYGALGAMSFVLVLQLQTSAGYTPLQAGVATLPVIILLAVLSPRIGALSTRIGPRLPLTVGPLLAAAGMLLQLRIDADHTNYVRYVLPGLLVFGLGLATLVAPLTATVMSSAPTSEVGIASGVNNAVARTASLLAIAVLPPLAGLHGDAYEFADLMTHGFRLVSLMCIVLLVAGACVVALALRPARADEVEPVRP